MSYHLSAGAVVTLMNGGTVEKPIVQLLGYKKIAGTGERYRLLISDGQNCHSYFMLATQLNDKLLNGEWENNSILRLDRLLTNQTPGGNKLIFIVLEVTVIHRGSEVGERIGNPIQVGGTESSGNTQPVNGMTARQPVMAPRLQQQNAVVNQQGNRTSQINSNNPRPLGNTVSSSFSNNPMGRLNNNNNNSGPINVHPINSLTPYQNKWTIRARVTNKSNIRTWSNSRGDGRLFSMDLVDETGEIRATVFTDLVDKFFNVIEIGKVYYISRAMLKTANKNFTSIKNDYEMTFGPETTVSLCQDDSDLPKMQYNFVPIKRLEQVSKDSLVDIIGVCKSASELITVTARNTNKEIIKRDIQIVDQSNAAISLTLWGTEAENFDASSNPVIAVKGAKLSDFNGCSVSTLMSSLVQINPDIQESFALRGWFDREGSALQAESISNQRGSMGSMNAPWKTFGDVKLENLGNGDKPDYYCVKGTIVSVKKENALYQACASPDCQKKVMDQGNGSYRCEKCNREYPNFKYRMLLQANLADGTDNQWVTCFQDTGEVLLGRNAEELGNLREQDPNEYDQVFMEAVFKEYIFKLRTKMETYNDESRLKTILITATPINFVEYNKKLLADIKKFSSM